jgi:hypothetical protein
MKYKMLALILALTVVSWAQTATQSTPSTPEQNTTSEKAKCACCDKMAKSDSKDGHAACMRNHDGKEMASCCSGKDAKSCCGKDAKSCMKGDKMVDCCKGKDGMKCDHTAGKGCGKGCCGTQKSEKPA